MLKKSRNPRLFYFNSVSSCTLGDTGATGVTGVTGAIEPTGATGTSPTSFVFGLS